jgi:hypothetical protein
LPVLDNFNRVGATLGGNWLQVNLFGVALRTNGTAAFANSTGNAYWNVPSAGFGAKQAAAFTVANATVVGDSLMLKTTGFFLNVPSSFIRVRYQTGQVVVETTTNFGATVTQTGVFAATLASGTTLTALANTDGSVDVWTTVGPTTTYLGRSAAAAAFTGTGRIGMQLNSGAQVDNFAGGTVA